MNLFKKILKKIKIIKNYLDKKRFVNKLTKKILKERYTVQDAKMYLDKQGFKYIMELEGYAWYLYDNFKYTFGWNLRKNIFFAVVYQKDKYRPIFTAYQFPDTIIETTDSHKEIDILIEKIKKRIEEEKIFLSK